MQKALPTAWAAASSSRTPPSTAPWSPRSSTASPATRSARRMRSRMSRRTSGTARPWLGPAEGDRHGLRGRHVPPDGGDQPSGHGAHAAALCEDVKGTDTTPTGDLSRWPDAGQVGSWAVDALRWCVGAGIINGKDGGSSDRQCHPRRVRDHPHALREAVTEQSTRAGQVRIHVRTKGAQKNTA